MTNNQLSYFVEVYKLRSIKKAAEYLMISPQGISKTIISLEKELNATLFKRIGSKLEPTRSADELFPHAYKILEEYKIIENRNSLSRHKLVIYSIDGVLEYHAMGVLKDFYEIFPDISLKIIELPNQSAIEHIRMGYGEIALLQNFCALPEVENHFLFSYKFCMVVNNKNPLSKKKFLEDADWDGQYIAGRGFEYVVFDNKIKSLHKKEYHPIVNMESNNEKLLLNMAKNNLAIACVSLKVAIENPSDNTSICLLEDTKTNDEIYLAYMKGIPLSPEAMIFRDFIIEWSERNIEGQPNG